MNRSGDFRRRVEPTDLPFAFAFCRYVLPLLVATSCPLSLALQGSPQTTERQGGFGGWSHGHAEHVRTFFLSQLEKRRKQKKKEHREKEKKEKKKRKARKSTTGNRKHSWQKALSLNSAWSNIKWLLMIALSDVKRVARPWSPQLTS